jgi:hypothetical protein
MRSCNADLNLPSLISRTPIPFLLLFVTCGGIDLWNTSEIPGSDLQPPGNGGDMLSRFVGALDFIFYVVFKNGAIVGFSGAEIPQHRLDRHRPIAGTPTIAKGTTFVGIFLKRTFFYF